MWKIIAGCTAPTRQTWARSCRSGSYLPCLADLDYDVGVGDVSDVSFFALLFKGRWRMRGQHPAGEDHPTDGGALPFDGGGFEELPENRGALHVYGDHRPHLPGTYGNTGHSWHMRPGHKPRLALKNKVLRYVSRSLHVLNSDRCIHVSICTRQR